MAHRRPSGDGLVRKRKDGRWEGRIMVGRDQEGKPIYRSVVDKSQKEMLERLHGLIEAYREVELTDRKNYTLGEWLDKWLNEIMSMHLRPSTISNYRNIIKYRIKPYLGDVPLHKVTRPDIQRMYVKIKKSGRVEEHVLHGDELSDSSVRSTHMLLHQAMDYAVKEKLILENPTNGTRIPKLNYAPMKVLDEVQLNAFLEVIEQDPIWYDFFYTGDVILSHHGRPVRPKTAGQRRYVEAIRSNSITFGVGPAGTGKTYLAMAMAVAALKRHEVSRIVLTRPVVEAGESLGFLPGTLEEKLDPYVRPLYDALLDMADAEKVATYMEQGTIEIAPLAFMRGRTFSDAFVILDEAQNTTPQQMKMFLTRMGFSSKFVVTGDASQRDLVGPGGLDQAREVLAGIDDIEFVDLDRNDIVRNALVARIVDAYDRATEERGAKAPGKGAGHGKRV